MHPYEMRALMRERGHDRAFTIREPSVYDTVARLASRGFIEPVEVSREGRRPERTVYAITEAGRDELLVWLRDLTSEPAADSPAFAAPARRRRRGRDWAGEPPAPGAAVRDDRAETDRRTDESRPPGLTCRTGPTCGISSASLAR